MHSRPRLAEMLGITTYSTSVHDNNSLPENASLRPYKGNSACNINLCRVIFLHFKVLLIGSLLSKQMKTYFLLLSICCALCLTGDDVSK